MFTSKELGPDVFILLYNASKYYENLSLGVWERLASVALKNGHTYTQEDTTLEAMTQA